jgi:3-dehydroquinate synthase
MPAYLQTLSVEFRYPVYFTRGLFALENRDLLEALSPEHTPRRARVLAVVDSGLARARPAIADDIARYAAAHAHAIELVAPALVIPGGEACKNDPAVLSGLLDALERHAMDRHAFVLAVGGGAVLDVACYAAAITHRGVRAVRVPTTVLAQADSAVGVKNGVNAYGKKNFWGTFAPPFAVLNDAELLATLAARDRIAGMAEAVKVALVRDPEFFAWIEAHADALAAGSAVELERLVQRSAELHLRHIATGGDPFELGSARPLDFGHWAAHKLENMTGYRLRHGEAVAIGMALDSLYAARVGLCDSKVAARVIDVLQKLGFQLWDEALAEQRADGTPSVLAGLEDFREHLGGELTITLLSDIGRGLEVHEVDTELVARIIAELPGSARA